VDLVAVGEKFVQFLLAEHGAQRGLSELRGLVDVVGNFDHGFARIDHTQKNDGIHFERNVVPRDDVLRRNFESFLAKRDSHHAVDRGKHQRYTGALGGIQKSAQTEDDTTFVLGQDLDGAEQVEDDDDDDNGGEAQPDFHTDASAPE